jgi:hypothetical protein
MYSAVVEIDRALLEQRFRTCRRGTAREMRTSLKIRAATPANWRSTRTTTSEEQLGQSRQHHVAHRARGQGVATLLDEIRGART